MSKHIDLIYRADAQKGAEDGGTIRKACKAICESVEYGAAGITAQLVGIDERGRVFCDACPVDCVIEVIGGPPTIYLAEVISW